MRLSCAMVLIAVISTPGLYSQEPPPSASEVEHALNDLRSTDLKVVSNAAVRLGQWNVKRAVPMLLEALQSPRSLVTSEHVTTGGMRRWILIDPKPRIVEALGEIGDRRAIPLLERYLRAPPARLDPEYFASALFLITGVRYQYRNRQNKLTRYVPGEEEFRRRSRPDLVPVEGLTAALEIGVSGRQAGGGEGSWAGTQPLIIQVSITNHSNRSRTINLSAERFVFSSLNPAGLRVNTPGTELPAMLLNRGTGMLSPGATLNIKWKLEKLATSALSHGWSTGNVNIKCVYRFHDVAGKPPVQVVSNSVARYYFSSPN